MNKVFPFFIALFLLFSSLNVYADSKRPDDVARFGGSWFFTKTLAFDWDDYFTYEGKQGKMSYYMWLWALADKNDPTKCVVQCEGRPTVWAIPLALLSAMAAPFGGNPEDPAIENGNQACADIKAYSTLMPDYTELQDRFSKCTIENGKIVWPFFEEVKKVKTYEVKISKETRIERETKPIIMNSQ